MRDDFAWLTEHSREIAERYRGKWIAVLNGEVIGVGDTATAAADEAERKYPDSDYILEAVERDPERI